MEQTSTPNFMTVHKLQLKQTGNTISGTEDEGGKSPKDGDVRTDQQPSLQCHDHIFFTEHVDP